MRTFLSSRLKLFLYNIMGATSCSSICWLHKLNFLYFWCVFNTPKIKKKSERILSRPTFGKVVVLNTNSCKCCHGCIRVRSFGLSAYFCFNIGGDSCHDSQQTRSQSHCEGGCKCPSVNIATNIGEITSKSSTFIERRCTAYRYMPMLSSKYRRQRFSPRRALLDGSLPPGNSCRIRCFSKRYLTHLTEVSGITAASGGAVPVQVSRSTRIPVPVLSVADSADVLRGEGKLHWLCPRSQRSVSLLTSRR